MATTGYCVKCKAKDREMNNVQVVEMKGKGGATRKAATGECAVCGTKMYKILPKDFQLETGDNQAAA
ncbi:MAG: DUF5679 domain-containing protein [Candidatus Pacebacteria bacterium]|jgi:hypothetical protein|nr:DUF5679 domain-containing protein [Candidatus Paceibacterota bacterium]